MVSLETGGLQICLEKEQGNDVEMRSRMIQKHRYRLVKK